MIPAITPPTDNLHKFISLFGLAIFLFAVYSLSIVYDKSAENKMQIEDIKVEVQKKLYEKSKKLNEDLATDSSGTKFRPAMIRRLDEDLQKVEEVILNSDLDPIDMIELKGKVSKLNVGLHSLSRKQVGCISFAIIGLGIMIFGFIRWQLKEQSLRDKILNIEHALKEKEKGK